MAASDALVLEGAHVIDPAQGIDRVVDVTLRDGKIAAIGGEPAGPEVKRLDLAGHYVTPGWVDIHVHAYGTLGFADPDSIGIYQGVTTFVDAGGPGIGVMDEFLEFRKSAIVTSLYAGPYIRPMGIIGLNFIEGDIRSLDAIPISRWVDFMKEHRDVLRYLKANAVGHYGTGPLKMAKGLSEILELPLYIHIGEYQQQRPDHVLAPDAFRICEKGDMITHLYHNNLGCVLDENWKVLPEVRDAERRGVIFDIGFGGYNFSWTVAEKAYAQDLVPRVISSDLQQYNVMSPTLSLANVMNVFLRLGMPLNEVIKRVTASAASAVSLDDRAGSLKPGRAADVTVFRVESGEFQLADCVKQTRWAERQIVPVMAFKGGRRYDTDLTLCQDERNWFLQFAEDHVPEAAKNFSTAQIDFLRSLAAALSPMEWKIVSPETLDLDSALALQATFHAVRRRHNLPLGEALRAVYDSFIDRPFTMQIALFLLRIEKPFVLKRLEEVTGRRSMAA